MDFNAVINPELVKKEKKPEIHDIPLCAKCGYNTVVYGPFETLGRKTMDFKCQRCGQCF